MISTGILILLMLCYLAMTVNNSARLAAHTEIILDHPFEVVISAGEVKLYISEMSLQTGWLERYFSADDVDFARINLEELERSLDAPVAQIEELYLGDAADVRAPEDTLAILQAEQTVSAPGWIPRRRTLRPMHRSICSPSMTRCSGRRRSSFPPRR